MGQKNVKLDKAGTVEMSVIWVSIHYFVAIVNKYFFYIYLKNTLYMYLY